MKPDKILIITGKSRYNALSNAAKRLGGDFEKLGFNVKVLDLTVEGASDEFLKTLVEGVRFVCTYQGQTMKTGELLYQKLSMRIVTILSDHPLYNSERFGAEIENIIVVTGEKTFAGYLQEYYPNIKHFVHCAPNNLRVSSNIKPYREREIDVYFPGSYEEPDQCIEEIFTLDGWLQDIINEVIVLLKHNVNWTLEEALRNYLKNINCSLNHEDFRTLMPMLKYADKYIRAYFRDKCVRTLIEYGISVTVCGTGWSNFSCQNPKNLKILDTTNFDTEKGIFLFNNAKIVLNVMPWFKTAGNARAEQAIGNGAIFLTDHSQWFNDNFTDEKDILLYSLEYIKELPQKIKKILNDDTKGEWIAKNGLATAKNVFSKGTPLAQLIINEVEKDEKT